MHCLSPVVAATLFKNEFVVELQVFLAATSFICLIQLYADFVLAKNGALATELAVLG